MRGMSWELTLISTAKVIYISDLKVIYIMGLMIRKRIPKWREPGTRSPKEEAMDQLLLLHLIKRANENRRKPGITQLQKRVFLIADKLKNLNMKALNYKFFRYNYGPMSKGIYEDFTQFVEGGFVTEGFAEVTEEGEKILNHFEDVFKKNEEFLSSFNELVDEYCKYDLDGIKDIVYNSSFFISELGEELKVKDIPENVDILSKVREKDATFIFDISDDEVETLEIYFNKEEYNNIKESLAEAKIESSTLYRGEK